MRYYKAGGEYGMKTLARICKVYKEKYPLVQIVLHTATADTVYESKWNNKKMSIALKSVIGGTIFV